MPTQAEWNQMIMQAVQQINQALFGGQQMPGMPQSQPMGLQAPQPGMQAPMPGMADGGPMVLGKRPAGDGVIPGEVNPHVADDTTINAKKGEFIFSPEVVAYYGTKQLEGMAKKAKEALGIPADTGGKTNDMPDSLGRMDAPGLPRQQMGIPMMGAANSSDSTIGEDEKKLLGLQPPTPAQVAPPGAAEPALPAFDPSKTAPGIASQPNSRVLFKAEPGAGQAGMTLTAGNMQKGLNRGNPIAMDVNQIVGQGAGLNMAQSDPQKHSGMIFMQGALNNEDAGVLKAKVNQEYRQQVLAGISQGTDPATMKNLTPEEKSTLLTEQSLSSEGKLKQAVTDKLGYVPVDFNENPQKYQDVMTASSIKPTGMTDFQKEKIALGKQAGAQKDKKLEIDLKKLKPGEVASMDQSTIDDLAKRYAATGNLPPLGMGLQAVKDREAILKSWSKMLHGDDMTVEGQIAKQSALKASQTELNNLQKQRGTVMAFAKTAKANFELVSQLSETVGRTGVPMLNKWVLAGKRSVAGDPEVAKFDAAVRTAINEYAKITSSATGGSVTSDSARKEVESMLHTAQTPEQVKEVIKLLRQEIDNREKGYNDQITQIKDAISGKSLTGEQGQSKGVQSPEADARKAFIGTERANTPGQRGKLEDKAVATQYLNMSGGDANKAREMARLDGWEF